MVRIERPTEAVLLLTIDRPDRRNAVDLATLTALAGAVGGVGGPGPTVRVVVLTGAPPAFCAGADLTGAESEDFQAALGTALRALAECPVPVIAAIDGPALGAGTQLVSVCDLRIATERSTFGIPAARLGLAVDQWTVDRLVAEFGVGVARAMLIGAEVFDTDRLLAVGAVHRVGGLGEALEWADQVAGLAPLTMATHKAMLTESARRVPPSEATEAMRRAVWSSADAHEGRMAFLEKRPARFTGM
jgi:enoyl-CoA hydratase